MSQGGIRSGILMAVWSAGVVPACADVAFNNFGPGDSYSGNGYILFGPQAGGWTQGFKFVAQASGGVTLLVLPMQQLGNGDNGYTFELYTDTPGGPGVSLGTIGSTQGFINNSPPLPPPNQIISNGSVVLSSGTTYWLVGSATGSAQGTWHQNDHDQFGDRAYRSGGATVWTLDNQNMAAFRVEVAGGPPACYANCDHSTTAPVLNALDFTCFLQKYAAGDAYANCDGSTAPPVLNALDFTCFLQGYAAGCR